MKPALLRDRGLPEWRLNLICGVVRQLHCGVNRVELRLGQKMVHQGGST